MTNYTNIVLQDEPPSTRLHDKHLGIWAPSKTRIDLHIVYPQDMVIPLIKSDDGYFHGDISSLAEGTQYFLRIDDDIECPDPGSHAQPEGVHGPSAIVNHSNFTWTDQHWKGLAFHQLIIYELHVGTFTPEGTFDAIIPRLDVFVETGINAIELMPVAQFPGGHNWGYDGVFPFAVQNSYGGPSALKRLVDACHERGIVVILDVVYNHLGPEGNYFSHFPEFFTDSYKVPWGNAINYDGDWSDGVRDFIVRNVRHWLVDYHIDGLRIDAIHTMYDCSARHILQVVNTEVERLQMESGRLLYAIAESDLNDPRVVDRVDNNGFGFAAQWLDDFHHTLYTLLDEEGRSRYVDFGSFKQLEKVFRDGFVLDGGYVKFRKKHYGRPSTEVPGFRFVAFNQNHDQIGNRPDGGRLSTLVDFEHLKLAMAALLLSPYVPMLFMGEEYAEMNPFFYFVSHSDEKLIQAVSEGRKKEFAAFGGDKPLPEAHDGLTFLQSKIEWQKRKNGQHAVMLQWTKDLIQIRKDTPGLSSCDKSCLNVKILEPGCLVLNWGVGDNHTVTCFLNFGKEPLIYSMPDKWQVSRHIIDSADYASHGYERKDKNHSPTITVPSYGVVVVRLKCMAV